MPFSNVTNNTQAQTAFANATAGAGLGEPLGGLNNADHALWAIAELLGPVSTQPGETGVTNAMYPVGDVRRYGAVGNGVTDDTAAIQRALTACGASASARTVVFPPGQFVVSSTLTITARGIQLRGSRGRRTSEGGSAILFSGTGACVQIGTSKIGGAPLFDASYENGDYDGLEGFAASDLYFIHTAPDTSFANGITPNKYKAGSIAIQDWRGGDIRLDNIQVESFDYPFWGIQSDLNVFINCIWIYSHSGWYLGPRSDQNEFVGCYGLLSDRLIWIDAAYGTRFDGVSFVDAGTSTAAPVKIGTQYTRNSYGTVFDKCWFEQLPATTTNIPAFIDVGVGDTVLSGDVHVYSPTILTNAQATPGHAVSFVRTDNGDRVVIQHPAGRGYINNLLHMAEAISTTVVSNIYLLWDAFAAATMAAPFANTGGVTGSGLYAESWGGASARQFSAVGGTDMNGRLYVRQGNTLRDFHMSAPADDQFSVVFPDDGSGNTTRMLLKRRMNGASAAPTSSPWTQGDFTLNQNAAVGAPWVWSCIGTGTPGTHVPVVWVPGSSTDNGDTSPTITATAAPTQRFDTTLTANRTITLPSNGTSSNGQKYRIVRTGLGAFTLTVQDATPSTLKVMPAATAAFVDVEFTGTAWKLSGYGTL